MLTALLPWHCPRCCAGARRGCHGCLPGGGRHPHRPSCPGGKGRARAYHQRMNKLQNAPLIGYSSTGAARALCVQVGARLQLFEQCLLRSGPKRAKALKAANLKCQCQAITPFVFVRDVFYVVFLGHICLQGVQWPPEGPRPAWAPSACRHVGAASSPALRLCVSDGSLRLLIALRHFRDHAAGRTSEAGPAWRPPGARALQGLFH